MYKSNPSLLALMRWKCQTAHVKLLIPPELLIIIHMLGLLLKVCILPTCDKCIDITPLY